MLTPCNFPVFISKLSQCKIFELSASVLVSFANFNYFFNTWMVSESLSNFVLSSLKLCCNALIFFHKHVLLLTNIQKIIFFFFQRLTRLVKFLNSFCCAIILVSVQHSIMFFYSLLHIQMSGALQGFQFRFFLPIFLAYQPLVTYPLSDPVFHH